MGIETTFVPPTATLEELRAAMRPNTRAVFAETLANPSLAIADLEVFAQAAHEQGVPLIVDNTFPTPINCRPIEFGADIVTHSTTKYMDGHAVQVGGVHCGFSGNFDWDERQVPRAHPAGRVLPRRGLHPAVWQGGLHHQGPRAADARPGRHQAAP